MLDGLDRLIKILDTSFALQRRAFLLAERARTKSGARPARLVPLARPELRKRLIPADRPEK